MDAYQGSVLARLKELTDSAKENIAKLDHIASLIKESISLQKEQLNFFVAIDKREMGLDDTNSLEYLTELRNDGFEPKKG
jgi:hypothetical protein